MIRISRRLDYGIHLMNILAQQSDEKLKSTASLSKDLDIPLPFLHQIAHTLMQQGLLKAVPGPNGGLGLNRKAEAISIYDIAFALEGEVKLAPCTDSNDLCPCQKDCITKPLWSILQNELITRMQAISINQLNSLES
jgi:Rrf2 family protein